MIVQFENGVRAEAVVLAAARDLLRVAVAGSRDTEEWLMFDGCWYDESGRRVEIEAAVAIDGLDYSAVSGEAYPKVAAAGHFN
jgi:hypothetical protein